jgi:hypothetical protein
MSAFRHALSYEIKVMKKYETPKQLADLEEKRGILMRRINKWREVQLAYVPAIGPLVANAMTAVSEMQPDNFAVEDIPLFLPSSLSSNMHDTPGFAGLLAHEVQLRIAQADDALANIRHHLRIISGFWQFKKVNVSGTGNQPNTRRCTLFNRLRHRTQGSVLCYRAAHSALLAADPEGKWQDRLKSLNDTDVRGPGKNDFYMQEPGGSAARASKGRFEISWIWLVPKSKSEVEADSSEQVFDEGMQVEWSKSQARMKRWEEEVHLIQEEMKRTIVYYEWKETWWLGQKGKRSIDDDFQHGIAAYAQKQAYYCKCLAESFAIAWLPFLESEGIIPEWKSRYDHLITGKESRSTVVQMEHLPSKQSVTSGDDDGDESKEEECEEEECEEEECAEEECEEEYGDNNIYNVFELDD